MTIIAAASWGNQVCIASDSAGSRGFWAQRDYGTKLREHRFGWAGYTGSYRVMQCLDDELQKIEILNSETALKLSSAVHDALVGVGWSGSSSSSTPECDGLEAVFATKQGELWTIQCNLAVLRTGPFIAAGCGEQIALGSMHRSYGGDMDEEGAEIDTAECAVMSAVEAAIALNPGCGGNIHYEEWTL